MSADQTKVLKACPHAGCYHQRGVAGAAPPYDKDHWLVYRDPRDISNPIGMGATEAEAWAEAAAWSEATSTKGP